MQLDAAALVLLTLYLLTPRAVALCELKPVGVCACEKTRDAEVSEFLAGQSDC